MDAVETRIAAGEVDVLLVGPERLDNPDFREWALPELAAGCGLLVVDEATASPTGARLPSRLPSHPQLPRRSAARVPVLATTATANARVTADVAEQLAGQGADR